MTSKKAKAPSKQLNPAAIQSILVFSAFVGLFNETILNVSLNTLMEEMHVTGGTIQWIVTAYMIIVAVMVPITAFLIQTFEIKKLYLGAMAVLLMGTTLAACSDSFLLLLFSRMIQAFGTGMMVSIMMTIVLLITPRKKHGTAMGICSCAIQLGPALGPTVSGLVLNYFHWHVLFLMLIPIILLLMVLGLVYLADVTTLTKPRIDILSILLSTIGVGGIIYGLNAFSSKENLTVAVSAFLAGILALLLFGKRQLTLKEPMLEIRTFKNSAFSIGAVLVMISMMTVFTMNIMLPMYLQGALKTTVFLSALAILPATLINGGMSLLSGRLYDKIGAKNLIPAGFFIILTALFFLSRVTAGTALIMIILLYIAVCIGIGSTLSPSQTNALSNLQKTSYPHGVAILNTLQQIAAAIGSSLFLSIMSTSQANALKKGILAETAAATGFTSALFVMLLFILTGFCLSLTVMRKHNALPSCPDDSKKTEGLDIQEETI